MRNKSKDKLISLILEKKEDFYRLAYSYVKNSEDALDIVQESIEKAIKAHHSIQDNQSVKSWFYRIVVNTSLDFLRKHKRTSFVDENTLDYYSSGKNDTYQNIDLERSLEELPVKYRTVIILKYFEDLKIHEVAEILNENNNTIKTRLYRALEMLKEKME
ncbi:MAG: RNA polymerase sigma factor [Bacillota bacterium]|uniref:RNA polymerase sigma factor n=1 Tax=Virgibacillus TaxID=84406 RepID=UPI00040EA736|nr:MULTISPECIES: RNA polymerase sigma factor [Bacillaceae]MCC2248608.1 RNA polymerase sigma factor [Virgibacillus sp. AGTR]MDY7043188.1 RNA polymerase sigma factor [Virgibacillus sp. M23]QRZ18365.1 RNA polymerase sigma factor [Virgibacillus sp. AGTR]WBX82011.1 RNA polymerase sigma factor [Virgibacillus salarius]